jgi:hypothetical protein
MCGRLYSEEVEASRLIVPGACSMCLTLTERSIRQLLRRRRGPVPVRLRERVPV